MSILVFEHHAVETSARLGQVLRDDGHKLDVRRVYAGDALPNDLDGVDGLVAMGGPQNVDQQAAHPYLAREMELIRQAHESGVPVLGVCLGAQLIAAALGGEVRAMPASEIGWRPVTLGYAATFDPILAGIPQKHVTFHAHAQEVTKLPEGAALLASSQLCKVQAFKVGLTTYAFQHHFEWTKHDIELVCGEQLTPEGVNTQPILEQGPAHYPMYRHLGDRLASNISLLLFPLEKRLDHRNRPVENFHAS